MKNYVQPGNLPNHTATAARSSGDLVSMGASGLVGSCVTDIANGAVGAVQITGVFRFTATAHGLAVGADVGWNLTTQVYQNGGTSIGSVIEVRDANTVDVLLNNLPSGIV